MRKFWWLILAVILVAVMLSWTMVLNVLCNQDGSFYGGICFINKFIPW